MAENPYKKATITSVFPKGKGLSAADLGGAHKNQTYSERQSKGRTALSTWLPTDVSDQLHELAEHWQMKHARDALVKIITEAYKSTLGG